MFDPNANIDSLTKREWLIGLTMQGLIVRSDDIDEESIVGSAISIANKLIAKLMEDNQSEKDSNSVS